MKLKEKHSLLGFQNLFVKAGLYFLSTLFVSHSLLAQEAEGTSATFSKMYETRKVSSMNTCGPDFVLLANGDGVLLANKARKRDFGLSDIGVVLKPQFRLFLVSDTIGRRFYVSGNFLKNRFGTKMTQIGYAPLPIDQTELQVSVAPISKDKKKASSVIPISKIIATVKKDRKKSEQLTQRLDGSEDWSYSHPAVHPNEKIIVFSANCKLNSNRYDPDGTGGFDLYYTLKIDDYWSMPQKFNSTINTPKDEIFPNFSTNGTLYFSSNGYNTSNDFDIYCVDLFEDLMISGMRGPWWGPIEHLPTPINTNKDELGFVWLSDRGTTRPVGYFSRGDVHHPHSFDIFSFEAKRTVAQGSILNISGTWKEQKSDILVISQNGDSTFWKSDIEGRFEIPLALNQEYLVQASAKGYQTSSFRRISTKSIPQGAKVDAGDFYLHPNEGIVLGQVLNLEGASLLSQTEIKFHVEDESTSSPELSILDEHFIVKTDKSLDFYIDVETSNIHKNSWHYNPGFLETKDTFKLSIYIDDSAVSIKQLNIAYEGTHNVPGVLVAKLLIYEDTLPEPFELAEDFDLHGDNNIRIVVPEIRTRRCSLVIFQEGYLPRVIDPAKGSILDTIHLKRLGFGSDSIIIYHGYNQNKPDFLLSGEELESISQYMLQNPEACIKVESHTDSRGSSRYNLALSQRRAEEVRQFILGRTTVEFANRITVEGKGERQPKVVCKNCSEADHQENRRTVITLEGLPEDQTLSFE